MKCALLKVNILVLLLKMAVTGCNEPSEVQQPAQLPVKTGLGIRFDTTEYVRVTNHSNSTKDLQIRINGRTFFHSSHEIIADAVSTQLIANSNTPRSALDTVRAIWLSTANRTVHNLPLSQLIWMHDPVLYYNSIGNGFCDDVANVNTALWRYAGYPARTWYLNGHVVSEVFQDKRWKMLDSDLGIVVVDGNAEILSVNDLFADQAFLLSNEHRQELSVRTADFDSEFWQYVARIFSNGGSIDQYVIPLDSLIYNYKIPLPPNGELIFGRDLERPPGIEFLKSPSYFNIVITIDSVAEFDINASLVPLAIEGQGQILVDGEAFDIGSCPSDFLLKLGRAATNISVQNGRRIRLTYMVNGLIFDLYHHSGNYFEIHGNDVAELTLEKGVIHR